MKCLGDAATKAMLEGVRSLGLDALPWDDEARDFVARAEFVRTLGRGDLAGWPEFSKEALARDLGWLEPFLEGITRRSQLSRVSLRRGAALAPGIRAATQAR